MRVLHMPVEGIIAGSLGEDMRATADTLVRSRKFLLPARALYRSISRREEEE